MKFSDEIFRDNYLKTSCKGNFFEFFSKNKSLDLAEKWVSGNNGRLDFTFSIKIWVSGNNGRLDFTFSIKILLNINVRKIFKRNIIKM
jgi:hypothetical protein